MKMQSLRWNLLVWNPSAGPADPYGAPRLAYVAWPVRAHWRAIFLVGGALLMVTGLMLLPSTVTFIAGVLMVASAAPTTGGRSPTAAMVRAWGWRYKGQPDHR